MRWTAAKGVDGKTAIAGTIGGWRLPYDDGGRVVGMRLMRCELGGVGVMRVMRVGKMVVVVIKDATAVVGIGVVVVILGGSHGSSHELVTVEWLRLAMAVIAGSDP